jgi:hypothetical protein
VAPVVAVFVIAVFVITVLLSPVFAAVFSRQAVVVK